MVLDVAGTIRGLRAGVDGLARELLEDLRQRLAHHVAQNVESPCAPSSGCFPCLRDPDVKPLQQRLYRTPLSHRL